MARKFALQLVQRPVKDGRPETGIEPHDTLSRSTYLPGLRGQRLRDGHLGYKDLDQA
jgi:hypothetical protein